MKSTLLCLAAAIVLASCGDAKKLQYLQGPTDPGKYAAINFKEALIQPGDILTITVFSANPAASAIYNKPTANNTGTPNVTDKPTASTLNDGYLVDNDGNIFFYGIGSIKAKGLTRKQLSDLIVEKLSDRLKDAYCQVRFTNFKVTVLGEVAHPSVFNVPSEKVSILEALGLAGDLTPYGRRDSVMVVRETDTERKMGWVDLRRTDIFNSEFYYLHQNDVVVVNPTRQKAAAADQTTVRNISLAATILSSLAVIYSLLTR